MKDTRICIVVPCYNEQEVLPETARRLGAFLKGHIEGESISPESRVLFVDDGSKDKTWTMIKALSEKDALFTGISLAHNRGHQNALWAGLTECCGKFDAVISIDADLQDDINAMNGFLTEFEKGADIVYGVREKRDTDSFFKRFTAESFYKVMDKMGAETVYNHADYRLLSARALTALMEYGETNLYLRGLVPTLGFNTATVTYERAERFAGESKYPLKKMLALAFQGITSFSVKPIGFILGLGIGICVLSLLIGFICLISGSGSFTLFSIWFMGGLILSAIGLVGEYAGKIYMEVKHRPRFQIKERT